MKIFSSVIFLLTIIILISCDKENTSQDKDFDLAYEDSIYYLQANDYVITPKMQGNGSFAAFPDDLKIDPANGRITITPNGKSGQSQTGLRYKIIYTGNDGSKDSTFIVLAGIHYQDQIYKMTSASSVINPIYNADVNNSVPNGTYSADRDKLAIDPVTGVIDFKQSIQNGFFGGGGPDNEDWKEVEIEFKPNDGTARKSKMDMIIYYYDSIDDIPSNVSSVMRSHQDLLLGVPKAIIPVTSAPVDTEINNLVSISKPRPPCIVIVGH